MPAPTHIAVVPAARHDGTRPDTGTVPVGIFETGTPVDGIYTLADAGVPAGAMILPLSPVTGLAVAAGPAFAVEALNEEPVITAGNGTISVTIADGPYAGTYTERVTDGAPLTVAMVETAPVPFVRPSVSGSTGLGDTLTVTPGLWLYEGPDLGDPVFRQKLDGVPVPGGTGLEFVIDGSAQGKSFTVGETYGGVTLESAETVLSAGAMNVIARDTAWDSSGASFVSTDSTGTLNVGPAAAGKRVYIVVTGYHGNGGEPDLVVDGITATPMGDRIGNPSVRSYHVDSDTMSGTVDAVLKISENGGTRAQVAYACWAVTGAGGGTLYQSYNQSSDRAEVQVSVPEGGGIIAVGSSADVGPHFFTGLNTEVFEFDWRTGEFVTGAEQFAMGADASRTIRMTAENGSNRVTMNAIVLTPA